MDSRVFLGLAGPVDYEAVWDEKVWRSLAREFDVGVEDLGFNGPVNDRREAVRAVLSLIAESRGNEIRVEDPEVSFWLGGVLDHRVTIGGTNFRAATILGQFGIPSIAQVSASDQVMESLVPESCQIMPAKLVERLTPNIIIQFPKSVSIPIRGGVVRSHRADRVILANDENIQHPTFPAEMAHVLANVRLAMVSSINAITDKVELEARLEELTGALRGRRQDSLFLWEDAGYHQPEFQELVALAVAPLVDIFSTNIEEAYSLTGLRTDIWDPHSIVGALKSLQQTLGARNVVMHCEGWAAVRGPDAKQIKPGLTLGQAVSSARYGLGDGAKMEDYERLLDGGPLMGPKGFAETVESLDPEVRLSPSHDVKSSGPVTVGLGDAFVGGVMAQLWRQLCDGAATQWPLRQSVPAS